MNADVQPDRARWMTFSWARPGHEFFSAPPLLAVGLFGLNNAWLKSAFPGWLTGKLSDLLFCFFFPLFVSALLELVVRGSRRWRLATGAVLAGASLIAVKTLVPASAALDALLARTNSALGLPATTNVVDPTDLVALPMVAVAIWYASQVQPHEAAREDEP